MINVSEEYLKSMNSSFRNRSHATVSVGLVNNDMQKNNETIVDDTLYISKGESITDGLSTTKKYITWEQNSFYLNKNQIIAPRKDSSDIIEYQGFISEPVADSAGSIEPISIEFRFDTLQNLYALSINFDTFLDNYPTDFTIDAYVDDSKIATQEVVDNSESAFTKILSFTGLNRLVITFTKMKNPLTRLRIQEVIFGIGLLYKNTQLVSVKLQESTSTISAKLPSTTLTVELQNIDGTFDQDNPKNVANFFEMYQNVSISFGYEIEHQGTIYWLPTRKLYLKELPETTDTSFTFVAVPILDLLENTFDRYVFNPSGVSLYDLATSIFEDAKTTLPVGVDLVYQIDDSLKSIITKTPLPHATHKECLQYIANLGRSTLYVNYEGVVSIVATTLPELSLNSADGIEYSNVATLLNAGTPSTEVLTWEPDFWRLDRDMYLVGDDKSSVINSGFISAATSDDSGLFSKEPELNIVSDISGSIYNLAILFDSIRNVYPQEITCIVTYSDASEKTFTWSNQKSSFIVPEALVNIKQLRFKFNKMNKPNNRLRIYSVDTGQNTDREIFRRDILSNPKKNATESISKLSTYIHQINTAAEREQFMSEELQLTERQKITLQINDVYQDIQIDVEGGNVLSQSIYTYTAELVIEPTAETTKITLSGKKVEVATSTVLTASTGYNGAIDCIDNPLLSDRDYAVKFLDWVFQNSIVARSYSFDYRGDPSFNALDLVYFNTRQGSKLLTRIEDCSIEFTGGISGSLLLKEVLTDEQLARAKNRLVR